MKQHQILSAGAWLAMSFVPEFPEILSTLPSQCSGPMGHGVDWKAGAGYILDAQQQITAVPKAAVRRTLATSRGARLVAATF